MFRAETTLRVFVLTVLIAFAAAGCDSCSPPEQPLPPTPDLATIIPDVSVEEEPVDPLKEARESVIQPAEDVAVSTADTARAFAAELEAHANKPKPKIKRPKMTGTIDTKAVKAVFNRHVNPMKKCYERELKRNPGLEGKVRLQVVILTSGKVGSAKVKGVSLQNSKINACMEREARGMKFPKPTGGAVTVANPYTFTPEI